MKYPLIILGAGASHDSLHLQEFSNEDINKYSPYRPPLANDLFRRKTWSNYIEKWDEISDLATDLVGGISRYGGIEPYLTNLLENVVPNNEKRAKQIAEKEYDNFQKKQTYVPSKADADFDKFIEKSNKIIAKAKKTRKK